MTDDIKDRIANEVALHVKAAADLTSLTRRQVMQHVAKTLGVELEAVQQYREDVKTWIQAAIAQRSGTEADAKTPTIPAESSEPGKKKKKRRRHEDEDDDQDVKKKKKKKQKKQKRSNVDAKRLSRLKDLGLAAGVPGLLKAARSENPVEAVETLLEKHGVQHARISKAGIEEAKLMREVQELGGDMDDSKFVSATKNLPAKRQRTQMRNLRDVLQNDSDDDDSDDEDDHSSGSEEIEEP